MMLVRRSPKAWVILWMSHLECMVGLRFRTLTLNSLKRANVEAGTLLSEVDGVKIVPTYENDY